MCHYVMFKGECLSTDMTTEFTYAGVSSNVTPQCSLRGETLATVLAAITVDALVMLHMLFEGVDVSENFVTLLTNWLPSFYGISPRGRVLQR